MSITDNTVFYACKYTPLELLAGYGVNPKLSEVHPSNNAEATNLLASKNICGFGKGLLERLLKPDVHAAVLTTCCDTVRRVFDIVQDRADPDMFLFLLDIPHKTGPKEVEFFKKQLKDLAQAYAAYSSATFDITRAIGALSPSVPTTADHVSLIGAHGYPELLEEVQASLPLPVANETCTARHIDTPVPNDLARLKSPYDCVGCDQADAGGQDPLDTFLDWYAPALLKQMPCMRMEDVSRRKELFADPHQKGVVYHTMKFCDYYGFEYAHIAAHQSFPLVKIETDPTTQSTGQLRTRLEAFGETLDVQTVKTEPRTEPKVQTPSQPGSPGKRYVIGIDCGSTSTDAVVMGSDKHLISSVIIPTGAKAGTASAKAIQSVLEQAKLTPGQINCTVATGYGRDMVEGVDSTITEITCHAKGAHYLFPKAHTIIDIGGQDSKVIHIGDNGEVLSFVMNDKCAAGTGRFLEMMARTLEMPLSDFCKAGLEWKHPVRISSMCTVFAESEVVSLVAKDTPIPDIIHGLNNSVARKTVMLARRVHAEPPYVMTGGVAHNIGAVHALSDALKSEVTTHKDSQLCGAIGAALLGLES